MITDVSVPIGDIGIKIAKIYHEFSKPYLVTAETRKNILNTKYHALPIDQGSINTMLVGVGLEPLDNKAYSELYKKLQAASTVESKYSLVSIRRETLDKLLNKGLGGNTIILFKKDNIIVSRNYDNMSNKIISPIFSNSGIFGNYKFNVGHTYLSNNNAFRTPGTENVNTLINVSRKLLKRYSTSSTLLDLVEQKFKKEYQEIHYISTSLTLKKEITTKLAKMDFVVVVAQEADSNTKEYATKERVLYYKVLDAIERLVNGQRVEYISSSPTFVQDLETLLINKLSNKSTPSIRKSTTKVVKSKPIKNTGIQLTKYRLRNIKGSFMSVTNLQSLISTRLQDTIAKNMTKPALVYRSGRFADSVKLNNVEYNNRDDSLLLFLSYMRYPYGTFEPGFAQGSKDRSPTALITKSVREIAYSLTKSRLKAIVT